MSNSKIIHQGEPIPGAQQIADVMLMAIEPMATSGKKDEPAGAFARKVFKLVDFSIAESTEATLCRPGCSYCCHYRVMVSPTEVFALVDHILDTWPGPRIAALKERLKTHVATVKPMSVHEHMTTNVPCPLLDENRCTAYAFRPVACRAHHEAATIDTCRETFDHPHSPLDGAKRAAIVTIGEAARLGMGLFMEQQGKDGYEYELGAALHEALTNADCARRYRKGSTAFPKVQDKAKIRPHD